MRAVFRRLALATVLLAGLAAAPEAHAQWLPGTGVYPGTVYYPPTYVPGLPYGYYEPPYLWQARRFATPYQRGWYYERYYPQTNQYFYRYRVTPQYAPYARFYPPY